APSDGRAKRLSAETGRADVAVVWNVPLRREVAPPERGPRAGGDTRLLYHGSIVPARVPDTLLRALARLPRTVSCCITGYDPAGGAYQEHLRALAAELKLTDRVEFTGPIGTRQELMERCAEFDVGLSLLPLNPTDFNEQTMLGASNKPFDYLAAGLALLVPDRGDWHRTFVEPGYGVSCDPASVASLEAAIRWLHENPESRVRMGAAGRERILTEWNYETAFAPVLETMLGTAGAQAGNAYRYRRARPLSRLRPSARAPGAGPRRDAAQQLSGVGAVPLWSRAGGLPSARRTWGVGAGTLAPGTGQAAAVRAGSPRMVRSLGGADARWRPLGRC